MLSEPPVFLDKDKALACVHCGLCLGACPTYLETGDENNSPRGRIYLMRAVQDGRMDPVDAREHLDLCLGCRACEPACPSGVEYGSMLEATRDHIERTVPRSPFQTLLRRILIEKIFPYPERMEIALAPAKWIKASGLDRWLPRFFRESLSLLPEEIESADLPRFSPALGERKGVVGFISGCVMSVMFGRTHRNSVRLLNAAGYDVVTPEEQVCCGALYAHGGNLAAAREVARRNIQVFAEEDLDAVVINAAGCGATLKEYGHLLHGDAEEERAGNEFSRRIRDLSEFLVGVGFVEKLKRDAQAGEKTVTFHDACHLAHPQGIKSEPRELVRAIAGDRYVELPEADVCCGSAGSYNLTEPEMAARLRDRKMGNIRSTSARLVVTTNPGCLLQIQAGLDEQEGGSRVTALHVADYLAGALGLDERG